VNTPKIDRVLARPISPKLTIFIAIGMPHSGDPVEQRFREAALAGQHWRVDGSNARAILIFSA
jgi:hypothetical protein